MNIKASQRVYRVPYVYVAQLQTGLRLVRIGHTMRPRVEWSRISKAHGPAEIIAHCRAYVSLPAILRRRFAYCAVNRQWFEPTRKLMMMAAMMQLRGPETLITADALAVLFAALFPDNPYAGVAEYRTSETYILRTRR